MQLIDFGQRLAATDQKIEQLISSREKTEQYRKDTSEKIAEVQKELSALSGAFDGVIEARKITKTANFSMNNISGGQVNQGNVDIKNE